jgi:two-component system cell cycle response regulator DivK
MGESNQNSLAGRRILLVDDTDDARRLLRYVLQLADAEILEFSGATDVLEVAQREKPDLILMDVHMPGLDGLSATRQLRAHEPTRNIPIVIVSASAMPQDREAASQAGCDGFIAKPIDVMTFAHEVAQFLRPTASS